MNWKTLSKKFILGLLVYGTFVANFYTLNMILYNYSVYATLIPFILYVVLFSVGVIIRDWINYNNSDISISHVKSGFKVSIFIYAIIYFISYLQVSPSFISTRVHIIGLIFIGLFFGFNAHSNYLDGNQPYQKYGWIPNNPLYILFTPYYAFKYYQKHNTLQPVE